MRVVISSGHAEDVRGAVGIIDEVDEARKVVEELAKILSSWDVDVTTYHDDVSQTQSENLDRIVDYHNSRVRDLDISIHFNAFEPCEQGRGCEVLYLTQHMLAQQICDMVCEQTGLINRGAKYRDDLAFLNGTSAPAVLIEVCFVDSETDVKIYQEEFFDICVAIADAIMDGSPDSGDLVA